MITSEVVAENGKNVTERGIVYSLNENPTVDGKKEVVGSGKGSFTANLTSLSENTTYYIKAYAINSVGTAYGDEKSFTTEKATGIEGLAKNKFKIYPNPSQGCFTLVISENIKKADLIITDIKGNIVLNKKINSESTEVDISEKAKGIYFLQVNSSKFSKTEKIILK